MRLRLLGPLLALSVCGFGGAAQAAPAAQAAAPPAAPAAPAASGTVPDQKRPPAPLPPAPVIPVVANAPGAPPASEAQRYCQNVAAAAADARFALQTRKLSELEGQIAKRVAELEAKEAEVKAVLAQRDEAARRASATLVGIYAKMRPDAAAQQISALDDVTAAAVLSGLNARQSSAILNEIAPDRAVKLVNTITGAAAPEGKGS